MKFEDLMIDRSQAMAEQAEILENRLIAIRNRDRQQNAARVIEQDMHRREAVTRFQGVNFINDSKSESINATYFSLKTISNDIVWIAGGRDEQTNYRELADLVSQKVKALICIGKDNTRLIDAFADIVPLIYQCNDMEEAVRRAFYAAKQGDTVLLSAASPCDNNFENYQERGNAFKKAIAQL
jgi:UDP-N-acetylmuramoylalanine--D-glutamate ligase